MGLFRRAARRVLNAVLDNTPHVPAGPPTRPPPPPAESAPDLSNIECGAQELKERLDVPFRVVIDQAVTLARRFGASESHRFVNGVLDRAARRLRAAETAARG